jgi:hypothetical protein
MKKYHHETVAGLFVLVGLICVGYLTVKLGNVHLWGSIPIPFRPLQLGVRFEDWQLH